jgi:hypothetical protein
VNKEEGVEVDLLHSREMGVKLVGIGDRISNLMGATIIPCIAYF